MDNNLLVLTQVFEKQFPVDNKVYRNFIRLSNDHNPLHTDCDFAKEKGFKDKVMHGNILNAFLSFFIGEMLPVKNVIIHSQEILFKKPVYMNDHLYFRAVVSDFFESVQVVQFKFEFKNQDQQMVAKGKIQIGLL